MTATHFSLEISVQPVTFETSLHINKKIKPGIFPYLRGAKKNNSDDTTSILN
jgi:hypothetical protein